MDFDELLADMKSGAKEHNAARTKAGYPTVQLVGWAEPPHYDGSSNKLYWAKTLMFEGNAQSTLNYNIRILGSDGVLVMNAVANSDQLTEVATGAKEILAATALTAGNRYSDFDPSLHQVAAYGIGGLIAGKVALKVGFLKGLLVLLAKGWKLVLLAVVGLGWGLHKISGRGKEPEAEPLAPE